MLACLTSCLPTSHLTRWLTRRAYLHIKNFIQREFREECLLEWILKREPPSRFCIKFIILPEKAVILRCSRKQASAIFLFRGSTNQATFALSLMDYSIQLIFERCFWKRKKRNLRMLVWRAVRNLRGPECKHFQVLIWSYFRLLENSSYKIEQLS